jgi:hypothetical protein
MSALEAIEARVRAKARQADSRQRAKRYVAVESARRIANLKAEGIVIPLSEWPGHAKAWSPLGVTYKQYVLEILERGRYLNEETAGPFRDKN